MTTTFDPAANLALFLLDKTRSEEHTSELQSLRHLVCRLLLEKKISRDDIFLWHFIEVLHWRIRIQVGGDGVVSALLGSSCPDWTGLSWPSVLLCCSLL